MQNQLLIQKIKDQIQIFQKHGGQHFQTLSKMFSKKAVPVSIQAESHLACDLGQSKIVFLEMQMLQGTATLTKCIRVPRPTEKEKVAEVLAQSLATSGFASNKVRISVKGQGLVVRFIQFPKMKPEDMRSAITFEAEKFIPFKFDEVVLDYYILEDDVTTPQGQHMMNLLLVAVKRDELYPLVQTFQTAGFELELIDVDALAFLNAIEFIYPDSVKQTAGALDIGAETSTLSIVREGKPRFIRDISFGGVDMLKRLKRKLGIADPEATKILEGNEVLTPEVTAVLKEGLASLIADLKVSLDYYMDQAQTGETVKTIFLGGGGSCHPIVLETLMAETGLNIQAVDMISKIQISPEVDKQFIQKNQGMFPIALGLCLRSV